MGGGRGGGGGYGGGGLRSSVWWGPFLVRTPPGHVPGLPCPKSGPVRVARCAVRHSRREVLAGDVVGGRQRRVDADRGVGDARLRVVLPRSPGGAGVAPPLDRQQAGQRAVEE